MKTKQHQNLTVERSRPYGYWNITALLTDSLGDYYHTMTYDGYTRSEAIARFLEVYGNQIKEGNN